ncbi:hypothetical protein [Streptomyces sp. NPDC007346]|uniref:hypothetical protein n=1 Tax=Streptomyces sp. NPDC007346 TaxID=3154682 RepID=UPI003456D5F0
MTRPTTTLLRLHTVAPELSTADLARAVSRTLTGEDSPPGGWLEGRRGQVLRHGGTSAEVSGAWDGPELRLRHRGEPAAAAWAAGLLDSIAAVAAGADPVARPVAPASAPAAGHDVDPDPAPYTDAPAYVAWRALMARWQVDERDLAEITAPGLLTSVLPPPPSTTSRTPYPHGAGQPLFVFDHIGPPEPPPGWLTHIWFAPDTGSYHCSAASDSRLSVRATDPMAGDLCAELLAAWRSLTARYGTAA